MIKIAKNDIQHILVPKHTILSEAQVAKVLETYNISLNKLPLISINDPAISKLGVKADDVIKVERISETAKIALFYRRVVA